MASQLALRITDSPALRWALVVVTNFTRKDLPMDPLFLKCALKGCPDNRIAGSLYCTSHSPPRNIHPQHSSSCPINLKDTCDDLPTIKSPPRTPATEHPSSTTNLLNIAMAVSLANIPVWTCNTCGCSNYRDRCQRCLAQQPKKVTRVHEPDKVTVGDLKE